VKQANPSLVSGSSRPLFLRKRPDLVVQRQEYLGRRYWVIKDPLALKYYRFEEEEYALLEMLDGQASLDELQSRFEARFAPQRIARQELHQLVGMLHRSSLLLSDAPGQGEQLLERKRERSRRARWAALGNVLSVRIRLCDPDAFLGWLNTRLGWIFSPLSVALSAALILAALLLVATHFEVFQQKLPSFHEFFASRNWIWLAGSPGADQSAARVRAWPGVQAIRRPVPRNGPDDTRVDALPVLQCQRLVDAVRANGGGQRLARRECMSSWCWQRFALCLVVQRPRSVALSVPERDVRGVGEHAGVQRESFAAV
jgi:hypothetical protein